MLRLKGHLCSVPDVAAAIQLVFNNGNCPPPSYRVSMKFSSVLMGVLSHSTHQTARGSHWPEFFSMDPEP